MDVPLGLPFNSIDFLSPDPGISERSDRFEDRELFIDGIGRQEQGHFLFELAKGFVGAIGGEHIGDPGGNIAAGIPGQGIFYVEEDGR